MEIHINDKFVITSDEYNFILNTKSIIQSGKNKGKERTKPIKFCPTLSSLANAYIQLRARQSTAIDFKQLGADVARAVDEIRAVLEPQYKVIKQEVE